MSFFHNEYEVDQMILGTNDTSWGGDPQHAQDSVVVAKTSGFSAKLWCIYLMWVSWWAGPLWALLFGFLGDIWWYMVIYLGYITEKSLKSVSNINEFIHFLCDFWLWRVNGPMSVESCSFQGGWGVESSRTWRWHWPTEPCGTMLKSMTLWGHSHPLHISGHANTVCI